MRGWLAAAAAVLLVGVVPGSPARSEDTGLFERLVIKGHAVRWLPAHADQALIVSYALTGSETANTLAINCRNMRAPNGLLRSSGLTQDDLKLALRKAFDRWQRVANIGFVEAAPGTPAQILVGEQVEPRGFAYTDLTLGAGGGSDPAPILAASICLNPQRAWKLGFDGNLNVYDLEYTLTHEIGHAIGLDHPGPRGHLMSFIYAETTPDLSSGDVAGAVTIYGPVRSRGRHPGEMVAGEHIGTFATGSIVPLSRGLENPNAK